MRFMTFVRSAEDQGPPPPALMEAIGRYGAEAGAKGTMVDMGGLYPSLAGVRVRVSGGKIAVTDGPFTESKEIVGGYAVWNLPTREAAVEAARRFMELHREHWPGWEGETEVRQLFEGPPA